MNDFLAILLLIVFVILAFLLGMKYRDRIWKYEIVPELRKDAVKRSRAVIGGQVSEQMAPYFPDFNFKSSEVRFIGKPIDFVVFKGMDEKKIDEVIFVEVKTGKSSLTPIEKDLRDTINNKKVRWEIYRIDRSE